MDRLHLLFMAGRIKIYNSIYFITSLLVFFYVLIRALRLTITYDEANTILNLVPNSVINTLNGTPSLANNHILNTLLIKLFYTVAPETLFVGRLPNVLASLLYLFFSYKITKEFLLETTGIVTFLLLILNPFLLDFFSVARGYGISLGCQMAALYYLCLFFKSGNSSKHLLLAMIFGSLTVLANLSTLNFFLAIGGTAGFSILSKIKEKQFKNLFILFFVTLALTLIIWEPVRKLKEGGNLFYGGKTGFYQDTLLSLANYTFYSADSSALVKISLNIFLIISGVLFFGSFKLHDFFSNLKNTTFLIFLFIVSSVILQHYLLGNLFIIDRSALFLYPILIVLLGFSLDSFPQKKSATIISALALFFFMINFLFHINFYKTATWFYDGHTKELLQQINEEGKKKNTRLKVDFSWPFYYSVTYHLLKDKYTFIENVSETPPELKTKFDYYIYLEKEIDKSGYEPLSDPIHSFNKEPVAFFPGEGVYLFKQK